MIDKNRLEQKCSMWNIALTGDQLDQLDAFAQILVDYNQKVNLTAITDPEGIEDKHFLDSLLFASQPEVAGKMVDVGAGAGFPGIVTKIFKPELELTLMEPTGKRVEFLKYACGQLGLTGVEFAKERAEEAARKAWREVLTEYIPRMAETKDLDYYFAVMELNRELCDGHVAFPYEFLFGTRIVPTWVEMLDGEQLVVTNPGKTVL